MNAASGLAAERPAKPANLQESQPGRLSGLIYAAYSDAVPAYKLDDYAYTILAQQLSTSGSIAGFGVRSEAIRARIEINPGALAAHGVGLEDVRSALVAATVNGPKGAIEGATGHGAGYQRSAAHASQFGNVIITYRNGAPMRIKDVGEAVDSVQNIYVGAWFDNKRLKASRSSRGARHQHDRAGEPHQGDDAGIWSSQSLLRCMSH